MSSKQSRTIDGSHVEDWYTSTEGTFLDAAFYDYGQAQRLAEQLTQTLGIPCLVHPLEGPGLATYTVKCSILENPLLVNPLSQHVTPDVCADETMEQEIEAFVQQGLLDGTYASAEQARAALFASMRDLLAQSRDPDPKLTEKNRR